MFVVASLLGCAPAPHAIQFAGEETVTVYTTDALAPNAATVLDDKNAALETQPPITWTVTPDSVAKLEGDKIVPVASGEAKIKACATEQVCKEYDLVVALPDAVALSGLDGVEWKVGTEAQLAAKVMSGTREVPNQKVTFASDHPEIAAVDETGKVTGVAVGQATITATAGELSATLPLTIAEGAAETAEEMN